MPEKQAITPPARTIERRSGVDRRKVDTLPPGKPDRRRRVEPRKPEVTELEMSNTDWTALLQNHKPFGPTK